MKAMKIGWWMAFVLVALGGGRAAAQERDPEPDSVVSLEPLVVRVLRTTVGTGTPSAVSVVAGDDLTRGKAGAFLEEALRAVPGVQIQNRYNLASGERLSIRGFGSRAQFGVRGVRVLVDGIPATLPDGQTAIDHVDPAFLGRVEILRGPGASLYGNAAGGVLHLESRAPEPGGPVLGLRGTAGSHGLRTTRAGVSGTAGDVGYRLGVSRFAWDGFRRNPVADDGSSYGGAERAILNGLAHVPLGQGRLSLVVNGLDVDGRNPGSLSRELLDEGDRQAYRFNVIQRTREEVRQSQAGLSWSGPLGRLDGEVALWGLRRELDGSIPPAILGLDRNAGGLRALFHGSQEAEWGLLSLSGGAEVEVQSDDRRNWDNDGGEEGSLTLYQHERVRSTGVFVQARADFSQRVAATAALRHDRFRFEADDRLVAADDPDDSGERVMDALSPSLGIVVRPVGRVELFGSVSRSFETPTTTELVNRPSGAGGFNADLEPTRGTTVEGGVRGRLAEDWVVEATVFRTGLDDELVPFEVPTEPGRSFFRNAGESRHRGWELTVNGRPTPSSTLRVAYTRVDARFLRYRTDDADYADNRIPGLAPHRLDGVFAVEGRLGYAQLRGLYQDAVPVDDANTAESGAYFLADVRVGARELAAGRVTLSPFLAVSNLFDRRYNTAVTVNAFGGRFFEPGPGRTFQAGLGLTWR